MNKKSYAAAAGALVLAALFLLAGCSLSPEDQTEQAEPVLSEGSSDPDSVNTALGIADTEAVKPETLLLDVNDSDGWISVLEENKVPEDFTEALAAFSFDLASEMMREGSGNEIFSPLSIAYALALAGSGAEGETADEINSAFGVTDISELSDDFRKLYTYIDFEDQRTRARAEAFGEGDYDSAISIANSLWISDDLTVKKDYQEKAANDFFASSYGVDFSDPDVSKRIGDWISEHTNGVLSPELTMSPETLLAIVNTLYFYGGWTEPFHEGDTEDDFFYLSDGETVTVPFMYKDDLSGTGYKGDGYSFSYLVTGNNCQMIFVLPDEGKSVDDLLENSEILENAFDDSGAGPVEVIWQIPKFSFGSSYDLERSLASLGIEKMFTDEAEFGGISDIPLYVSAAVHEAHIGVDESGVEGAAYTVMVMNEESLIMQNDTLEMNLDRPFLFGIREMNTGTWLFMGVCRDPSLS